MVKTKRKSHKDFIVGLLAGLPKTPKAPKQNQRFCGSSEPKRFTWLPDFTSKGQFFFPDLIIALIVFIIILAFFFLSSHATGIQIDLYYTNNNLEETSHTVVNPLVLFSGEPYNWEIKDFADLNRIGLVSERNVLNVQKVNKFVEYLTNNYSDLRAKMSLGKYDFKFELHDFNGSIIKEGGYVNPDFVSKITQNRVASYNGRQVIVKGIISYAK